MTPMFLTRVSECRGFGPFASVVKCLQLRINVTCHLYKVAVTSGL